MAADVLIDADTIRSPGLRHELQVEEIPLVTEDGCERLSG